MVNELDRPNGLAFSPDESILYVADTGEPRNVAAFDVNSDGESLSNLPHLRSRQARHRRRLPLRRTRQHVDQRARRHPLLHDAAGELIGKVLVPEQRTANCTFGDEDRKTLYICGDVSLYSVRLNVAGA